MPLARCLPYHQTLAYPLCSFHVENTWIAELFHLEEKFGSIKLYYLPSPPSHTPTCYCSAWNKTGKWAIMYLCYGVVDFVSFYDLFIDLWKCCYRVVFFIFHSIHSICFSYILETVTQPSVCINKKRLFSTHSSTTLNSLGIAIEMVTLPIKSRPPATYQYDTPIWISMTDGCF